ncbi:MAG: hypothetical protein ABR592_11605 [Nitriliruptorales bacterium]
MKGEWSPGYGLYDDMARVHRSVRVDADLLAELDELARERAVPVTFAEQVDAGLRLLIQQRAEARLRRSAALVAADEQRARKTYRQLHSDYR